MATKTAQVASNTNAKTSPGQIRATVNAVARSQPVKDLVESAREYVHANPESAALWCFGIGFVLAWKLKPW